MGETFVAEGKKPIQIVLKWLHENPGELIERFDFTTAMAAIWWTGSEWDGVVHERFFQDLAAKRLVYSPLADRSEARVAASILRMIKFVKRGYNIQVDSLAKLLAGTTWEVLTSPQMKKQIIEPSKIEDTYREILREVDPLPRTRGR